MSDGAPPIVGDAAAASTAEEAPTADAPPWFAYVLWSARLSRSYVGITTDLPRRFAQHQGLRAGGARATRAGRPWTMAACYGPFEDRSAASRAEYAIRRRRGRGRFSVPGLPAMAIPAACAEDSGEEARAAEVS